MQHRYNPTTKAQRGCEAGYPGKPRSMIGWRTSDARHHPETNGRSGPHRSALPALRPSAISRGLHSTRPRGRCGPSACVPAMRHAHHDEGTRGRLLTLAQPRPGAVLTITVAADLHVPDPAKGTHFCGSGSVVFAELANPKEVGSRDLADGGAKPSHSGRVSPAGVHGGYLGPRSLKPTRATLPVQSAL